MKDVKLGLVDIACHPERAHHAVKREIMGKALRRQNARCRQSTTAGKTV